MAANTTTPGATINESGDFETLVGPSGTFDSWFFNETGTYTFQGSIDSGNSDSIDQLPVTFDSGFYIQAYSISLSNITINSDTSFTLMPLAFQPGDFHINEALANKSLTSIEPTSEPYTIGIGNGTVVLNYTLVLKIGSRPTNQSPSDLTLNDNTVAYSEGNSNVDVGTLLTTDPDTDDNHTYTLTSGDGSTDNNQFIISNNTLQAKAPQDMAPGNYSVRIRTEDEGGLAYEKILSVTVADDLSPEVQSITAARGTPGTIKYTVTFNEFVNSVNADAFTLTPTGTSSGDIIEVSGSGSIYTVVVGNLSGDGNLRLDLSGASSITDESGNIANAYSSGESYYVDGMAPVVTPSNISLIGANGTNGEFIVGDTVTVQWNNSANGDHNSDVAAVTVDFSEFGGPASVKASLLDGIYTATYTITQGNLDVIDSNVIVTATDDVGNQSTCNSADVSLDNELPDTPSANAPLTVLENAAVGTIAGSATATADDGLSFSLTDDAGGRFSINSITGEIMYTGGGLDHETNPTLSVDVTTTDNAGNTAAQSLDIDIRDVTEAPVVAPVAEAGDYNEGDPGTALWIASGIDPIEAGQSLLSVALLMEGVADGAAEQLISPDISEPINLAEGIQNLTFKGQSLTVTTIASGANLEISLDASTISMADWQTLLQSLAYRNLSDDPTAGSRQVSVILVQDDGGITNNGTDTTTGLFGTRSFQVLAVNDAPTIDVNNSPSVLTGNRLILANTHLNEGDPDDDGAQLTYTLETLPTSGALSLNNTDLGIGDTFTQKDIDDGLVAFTAGGIPGTVTFNITLADGGEDGAGTVSETFTVNIIAPPPRPPVPEPEPSTELPDQGTWDDLPDEDGDGVPEAIEDFVTSPTGVSGDGNDDGIADRDQQDVASVPFRGTPTPTLEPDAEPVFVSLTGGSTDGKSSATGSDTKLINVRQQDKPEDAPDDLDMPLGLIAFEADIGEVGGTETFSLYMDDTIAVNGYWKQNADDEWVNLASAEYGGKVVLEGNKLRLDFELTDGGEFDEDGVANGIIVDPGALAFDSSALSEQVQALYIAYYQRPADSAGLDFWVDHLHDQNGSLEQVVDAFANSEESHTLYGEITEVNVRQFIVDLYDTLFDRAVESAGLTYYRNAFIAGEYEDGRSATAGTLMLDILQGAQNDDASTVELKLEAARTFTWLLDPNKDGDVMATFDASDLNAVRDWLQGITETANAPGVGDIHSLIKDEVAEAGDPITLIGDNGISELLF